MSSKQQKVVKAHEGKPLREILIEYYERYGNQQQAANALGVSQGTFSLWMRLEGLMIDNTRRIDQRANLRVTELGKQALKDASYAS